MDDTAIPIQEGRERAIERAIMDHPEELGFPGALSIRNCKVALDCGLVDIVLFPEDVDDPVKFVLVEAKAGIAPDATSKVISQLLMYYAGMLMLGSEGLRALRSFADNLEARDTTKKTLSSLPVVAPLSGRAKRGRCLRKAHALNRSRCACSLHSTASLVTC